MVDTITVTLPREFVEFVAACGKNVTITVPESNPSEAVANLISFAIGERCGNAAIRFKDGEKAAGVDKWIAAGGIWEPRSGGKGVRGPNDPLFPHAFDIVLPVFVGKGMKRKEIPDSAVKFWPWLESKVTAEVLAEIKRRADLRRIEAEKKAAEDRKAVEDLF